MSRLLEDFFGVSIGRLTALFSGFLSELNNLYLAAIDALLLMSSREGLRPPLSVLNCFSQALSSSRSVIVSVAIAWRFGGEFGCLCQVIHSKRPDEMSRVGKCSKVDALSQREEAETAGQQSADRFGGLENDMTSPSHHVVLIDTLWFS